jgi:predicted amidohydrolase
MALGLQICSDINRPTGAQLLAAAGAEVIAVPRATPPETYERWKLVMRAAAAMNAVYVVSVNRPRSPREPMIGSPSLVVDPFGGIEVETEETIRRVTLHRRLLEAARAEYPGYLAHHSSRYAAAWAELAAQRDITDTDRTDTEPSNTEPRERR